MDKPTCKTCEYWDAEDDFHGLCRRNPPLTEDGFEFAFFPKTHHDCWCGQHSHWYKWQMELQAMAVEKRRQEAASCTPPSASSGDPGTIGSAT